MAPRSILLAALASWFLAAATPTLGCALPPAVDHRSPLFTRTDAWYAAAAIASVALAARADHWTADEAPENNAPLAIGVSHTAERLGNPLYVVPALVILRVADALEHRSDREASLVRIAEGAGAAVAVAGAHWGSDVVAGAAIGTWTARKVIDIMRHRKLP